MTGVHLTDALGRPIASKVWSWLRVRPGLYHCNGWTVQRTESYGNGNKVRRKGWAISNGGKDYGWEYTLRDACNTAIALDLLPVVD